MEFLRRRGRARVVGVIYLYLFRVDVVEVVDDRRALEELGARVRVAEERHLETALFLYHSVPVRTAARARHLCVEQASRRWRGRRDSAVAETRRDNLISTQHGTMICGRVSSTSVSRTGRTKGDVS